MRHADSNFVLGNARIANVYPIVYCSDGFVDLTGFTRAEIMQKSCACHFLYGPKTDVQVIEDISRALKNQEELKLEVILYKKTRKFRSPNSRAGGSPARFKIFARTN